MEHETLAFNDFFQKNIRILLTSSGWANSITDQMYLCMCVCVLTMVVKPLHVQICNPACTGLLIISVARIFSRALFFSKSRRPFSVVVLNTHAKTAKLTTTNLQPSPSSKNFLKNWTSCSAWGALTTYPYKLRPQFFSPPWGCSYTHCIPWLSLCHWWTLITNQNLGQSDLVYWVCRSL